VSTAVRSVRHTVSGWDPTPAVRRALDPASDRSVLKGGRRLVVRVEAAGPIGEPLVVKHARLRLGERLAAWLGRSPGEAHWLGARLLGDVGVGTAPALAVLEEGGAEAASTIVCGALDDAEPLRPVWLGRDRLGRRRLARALGETIAALHRGGVYVPDLRDANLMVRVRGDRDEILVVDLDRWSRPRRGLSSRRRFANLVQLERTLGWFATPRDKLALLGAYRRALPAREVRTGALARAVERARRRKDGEVARRRRRAGIQPDERVAVSALVICGDERDNIRACLESLSWCDEIIVVDSMSTDGTFDIVRAFATRALRRPWRGHRAQKQYALDQATKPWVLNVDADERVPAALRAEIEAVLAHDGAGCDGFEIPRLVEYLGRTWRRGGWYPDRKLRLFRRGNARWGGVDPHERAEVAGTIGRLVTPILHRTYDGVADHVETIDRFTTIAADQRSGRPGAEQFWLRPLGRFLRFYLWKVSFLEGFPGLFLAISASVYTFLKYAKQEERAEAVAPPAGRDRAPGGPDEANA
jgi:hypothetical protein